MSALARWRWPLALIGCAGAAVLARHLLPAQPVELGAWPGLSVQSPRALSLLALLPLLALATSESLTDLPRGPRLLSLALRALLLTLLALALAQPTRRTRSGRVALVVAVDVSDSVSDRALGAAAETVEQLRAALGDNHLQLVTFDSRPRRLPLPPVGSPVTVARAPSGEGDAGIGVQSTGGAETHIARALQFAYGLFPAGHLRRVLLLTDGAETRGDLLGEAERARALGVTLHYRSPTDGPPQEVAVASVTAPASPTAGSAFEVGVVLHASRQTRATLRLYRDGVLEGPDSVRTLTLEAGRNEARFGTTSRIAGELVFRAVVQPEGDDRFPQNNSAELSARVIGSPRVLVVDREPRRMAPLARALGAADLDAEVRSPAGLPRTLQELSAYDFLMLSDTPASRLSREQMRLITRFVRDLGGGFMMVGGEQAFGPGGYVDTPLAPLLPVRMDSQRRVDDPSLGLALVIDCSGSMSGLKMDLAKEAARATAGLLSEDDSIAVIGFSGQPERTVRMQRARSREKIAHNISRLMARGGTAIFPALDLAYQDLLIARARIKHVILLTDGQTQEAGIPQLVQQMLADGITVSTVGLGSDVNRDLLQTTANLGGGRAHFTDDPRNVPRIFMRETSTVGRSSAVEELFQPVVSERADFMAGLPMTGMPFLRGYVATAERPRPVQVLLRSDLGEPVLARWHVGLGWSLAWTSDLKPRWATDLLRWSAFPRFVGQLVREHMRVEASQQYPLRAWRQGDEVVVEVDAVDAADRFVDGLNSELHVRRPSAGVGSRPQVLPLRQTAPGIYQARLRPRHPGSLTLHAAHRRGGKLIATSDGHFAYPYPLEFTPAEGAAERLAAAAKLTGGGAAPDATALLSAGAERRGVDEAMWWAAVLAALVVFFVDLLTRRLQLYRPVRWEWGRAGLPHEGESTEK